MLLWAYGHGVFPMADPEAAKAAAPTIDWYFPDPRGILPLEGDAFGMPGNVAREVRRGRFEIGADAAFEQVIRACAVARSPTNQSWLNEQLIAAYIELHRMGHAHSIEARRSSDRALVGGLYGVQIGGAFFGESMFHRPELGGSNSSKVCLVHLVRWLRQRGFTLLDTQFWNPHLDQFGCIEIAAEEYLDMLARAIRLPATWGQFEAR